MSLAHSSLLVSPLGLLSRLSQIHWTYSLGSPTGLSRLYQYTSSLYAHITTSSTGVHYALMSRCTTTAFSSSTTTFSFHFMLLPDSMALWIYMPFNSHSTAWTLFDGHRYVKLKHKLSHHCFIMLYSKLLLVTQRAITSK